MSRAKSGITRRQFGSAAAAGGFAAGGAERRNSGGTRLFPGIWRLRLGVPESVTPVQARRYEPARDGLSNLPEVTSCPVALDSVRARATRRGYEISLPLGPGEMIYGLGLQFHSFLQRGLKKKLRVNADPVADLGDSHAPAPFFVTTGGYGVLVDSARYVTIYCGNKVKKNQPARSGDAAVAARVAQLPRSYERFHFNEASEILIEIPEARGVDLYIFGGPDMRVAVQGYNLFSGGGALPPRWGLGFWYRCYGQFNQPEVLAMAEELRKSRIPCDVLGLEPGWQSHSYSCSFVWSEKFPDPSSMLSRLEQENYKVNLWEHAFTHPSSPLYNPLLAYSGDYEVWGGIVPDFLDARARNIFGTYHEREFVEHGISGFKLDECDNSDYTNNWSFPELSTFPSGVDGEQMHCLFGLRYQDAIQGGFERQKRRTLGLVRSSHALAAPYPYVLYSDLYDHKEFIRGVVNAGFSGLLWCPEVRDARDTEDLIRRLQTVIFSPLAMVNAWYIKNPPWKQVDREANNAGRFAEAWETVEASCRRLIEVRMQLVPYLYSAFARYHLEGLPPCRALVIDYPDDPQVWPVDTQYLLGDSLLVAPVIAGEEQREVYLPEGEWYDFWTGRKQAGKQHVKVPVPLDQIPVFVKTGTVLPLAQPTLHTAHPDAFVLTARVYGEGNQRCLLYEDDGSMNPAFTRVTLAWDAARQRGTLERSGPLREPGYTVKAWQIVKESEQEALLH